MDLRKVRDSLNITQTELAEKLGVTKSYISLLESGKQAPSKGILKKMELLNSEELQEVKMDHIERIPLLDIQASAGTGILNYDRNIKSWVGMPDIFIFPHNPKHVALLEAQGISMQPTIDHKDLLLVAENEIEIISEKMYIIRMADELRVKRLIRKSNGNIIIWSENEAFGREELTPQEWEDRGIVIVAKVIKVIKDV